MDILPNGGTVGGSAKAKRGNTYTPQFRVSYPYMFRPQKPMEAGKEPSYSITMLFKKGEDLSALKKDVVACIVEKFGPDQNAWPKMKLPFRDQGDKQSEGYEKGAVFITATSKKKPGLLDANAQPILNESEFYAGCFAHATVRAFYYDKGVNKGVAFGLQNVQKVSDGPPLSSRPPAEEEFKPIGGGEAPATAGADPMAAIFGGV